MNISILICSLKYIAKNYHLVTCLSTWINEELKETQLTIRKFQFILLCSGYELLESLIHLLTRDMILTQDLNWFPRFRSDIDCIKILRLFVNNNIFPSCDKEYLLEKCCEFGHYDLVKVLLEHGYQLDRDTSVFKKLDLLDSKETSKNISRLLLKYGQITDLIYCDHDVSQEYINMLHELYVEQN